MVCFQLCCRLELERDLQEYQTEQQVNAQYVEEFAMLTSEKVSFDVMWFATLRALQSWQLCGQYGKAAAGG